MCRLSNDRLRCGGRFARAAGKRNSAVRTGSTARIDQKKRVRIHDRDPVLQLFRARAESILIVRPPLRSRLDAANRCDQVTIQYAGQQSPKRQRVNCRPTINHKRQTWREADIAPVHPYTPHWKTPPASYPRHRPKHSTDPRVGAGALPWLFTERNYTIPSIPHDVLSDRMEMRKRSVNRSLHHCLLCCRNETVSLAAILRIFPLSATTDIICLMLS
jgi:hypothetical protein